MPDIPPVMRVAAAAGAAYQYHKRLPTVAEIAKIANMPEHRVIKYMAQDKFKEVMRMRGYDGFGESTGGLTPQQIFTVGIITNPTDRRPLAAKLKSAGITYATYRAWLKTPSFMQYINKIGEDMLGEHVADVHTAIVNKASSGDINAARLFYEVSGRHDPNKQAMADINSIVSLLLEIITRYVRDVDTLSKISMDIERVMSGGTAGGIDTFDPKQITASEATVTTTVVTKPVEPPEFDFNFEELPEA